MSKHENMVFNHRFAYERITADIDLPVAGGREFIEEAAHQIAKQMLANGCLIHKTEYDIRRNMHHEIVHVLVAQRERRLP